VADFRRITHRHLAADAFGLHRPINIGSDEMVTIDGLVDIVAGIAAKSVKKRRV